MFIVYCFDLIFSFSTIYCCLNSHYKFVQQWTTLLKFSHNFILFHYYGIFLSESHALKKYSYSQVYWTTIQCKEWDFDFSFNFLFIVFFCCHTHFVVLGLALSFDDWSIDLTLCSSILVGPKLTCLELNRIIFVVSWIMWIANSQALPSLLLTIH